MESKSTSSENSKLSSQLNSKLNVKLNAKSSGWQRGLEAEIRVEKAFTSWGWVISHRRWRTPFAEVDLVVTKNKKIFLLEVKSVVQFDEWTRFRLPPRQKRRLRKALEWYNAQGNEAQFLLVFVDSQGRLNFNLIQ